MREDDLDRCRMFTDEMVGELRVSGCVSLSDVVLGVGSEMGLTLQGVAHSGSMCVFLLRAVVWCHERDGAEAGKQPHARKGEEGGGEANTPREEARPIQNTRTLPHGKWQGQISPFRRRLVDIVGLKRMFRELHQS